MKNENVNLEALEPQFQKAFILGGKAKFSLTSMKTGQVFTYRVSQNKNNNEMFFVMVWNPTAKKYSYLGLIVNDVFKLTKKSNTHLTKELGAFSYTWENIINGSLNSKLVKVSHFGTCSNCSRQLTDPESIRAGLGPICFKNIYGQTIKNYFSALDMEKNQTSLLVKKEAPQEPGKKNPADIIEARLWKWANWEKQIV